MPALTHGRSYVCYSKPGSRDEMGKDFDATGHLSRSVFDEVGIPREADVYLCGPTRFMADMKEALAAIDVATERIHVEIFNGSESALRLRFRRFVLKHIPMLGELAVFEADDDDSDPGHLPSTPGETTVRDDVFALGEK